MMDQELFAKKLKDIECLEEYDYFISSGRYPTFRKIEGDRVLTIGVGDLAEMKIHSIGCHIIFASIESVIQNIDQEWNKDWKPTIKQYIHTSLTGHEFGKGIYDLILPLSVMDEDDLIKGNELVSQFYKQDALPFFNYWKDIRVLLPWLELDYDDFAGMNKVFLQDSVLKKLIVWYLTSHPYYEDFVEYHESRLEEILAKQSKNLIVKKGLKRLREVRTKIELTKPIYQWSPEYLKPIEYKSQEA
jgi:hypothetical protein